MLGKCRQNFACLSVAEFKLVPGAEEKKKKTHPPTLPFLRLPGRQRKGNTPPPPYVVRRFFALSSGRMANIGENAAVFAQSAAETIRATTS